MIFDLYAVVSNFSVKNVHNLLDPLSDCFPSYVACVCNHCSWMNQNRLVMISLKSHHPCVYEKNYYYRFSFSLTTSLTMMGLGPGNMVRTLFHFPLKNPLVVSVAQLGKLVESHKYFPNLVKSQKYFPKLVESQKYFPAKKLS